MNGHGISKGDHDDLALVVFQLDPMTNVDFALPSQVRRHDGARVANGVALRRGKIGEVPTTASVVCTSLYR